MSSSIGEMAFVLRAPTDRLEQDLSKAKKAVAGSIKETASEGALGGVLGKLAGYSLGVSPGISRVLSGAGTGAGVGNNLGIGGNSVIAGAVGGLVGAAAAALASALSSVSAGIERTTDRFRQLSMVSSSVGLPIEKMQLLAGMGQAAGVPLEAMAGGLKLFNTTLQDAKGGVVEAQGKFRALGIDIESLKGKSNATVLDMVADSLARIKDPAERARAAMLVMGEEGGAKMSGSLGMGSAKLRELNAEYVRMGVVMDSSGIAKTKQLTDAQSKLGLAWDGLYNQLTVLASEPLTNLMTNLSALVTKLAEASKWFGKLTSVMPGGPQKLLYGVSPLLGLATEAWSRMGGKANADVPGMNANAAAGDGANVSMLNKAIQLAGSTPLESFNSQLKILQSGLSAKVITLAQFSGAVTKLGQGLVQASGVGEFSKGVAPALAGSREAVESIIRNNSPMNDPASQLRQAIVEQSQIQRQQVVIQQAMLAELKKDGGKLAPIDL